MSVILYGVNLVDLFLSVNLWSVNLMIVILFVEFFIDFFFKEKIFLFFI